MGSGAQQTIDDTDDIGEFYRAARHARQDRRMQNGFDAEKALRENVLPDMFVFHNHRYHWQTVMDGDLLDYWPNGNQWRYRGQSYSGTPASLAGFIRNRGGACRPGTGT